MIIRTKPSKNSSNKTMTEIKIERENGKPFVFYLYEPVDKTDDTPVVICCQEWWGVNEYMHSVAQRFANAGFCAVLPDFYFGEVGIDRESAGHLMSELSWTTSGEIVQCIVDYFRKENSSIKIGITGWCMGGALSLYCAATLKDQLQAAVPFYGIPPEDEVDLTDITCPLLGHWAKVDDWCSPEKVSELDEKLTKGNVAHTFYTYDAQHAFSNSTREEVYDAKCAQQAYDRTFVFFGENLI
eukprot:TRINITY_DN1585_c0_g1_i1.p1 TRINITY_DN1585_c0_g1~~TRINITY_DN1585_c0_g1_i1.p1  ORF type:complete len:241 (-),score=59.09 TRINITY_DN1585_c0_g1_i1:45-767(-)